LQIQEKTVNFVHSLSKILIPTIPTDARFWAKKVNNESNDSHSCRK